MTAIVVLHSYRGGTGKTNIAANLAVALFRRGRRVAIVDTDLHSPGLHVPFAVDSAGGFTLNDFLWGRCAIADAAADVAPAVRALLPAAAQPAGAGLAFVPASARSGDIARILKEGYEVELLNDGLAALCESLALDYLLIDTHPGLNEETLLSFAIADTALVLLRPDYQDYQGTAVTLELARRLSVPRLMLAVNKVHPDLDAATLSERIAATYDVPVAALFRLADELVRLGSAGLVGLLQPSSPFSLEIERLASVVDG